MSSCLKSLDRSSSEGGKPTNASTRAAADGSEKLESSSTPDAAFSKSEIFILKLTLDVNAESWFCFNCDELVQVSSLLNLPDQSLVFKLKNNMQSLLVATILALASTAKADQCATSELLTLASNPNLEGCTSAVGFGGFAAISALTEDQIEAVCDSSACLALMDDMRAMGLGDCTIEGTNTSLEIDILDPFKKMCSGSGSVDLASASGSSSTSGAGTVTVALVSTIPWALVVLL
ncbi:unnamed protein product [Phytophthora lilii]|uniref:Unnamed protein product n=1 Tax=Phytophthora lilii TaxID=2077276 RepID=A0A9W6TMS2_9STRA|nr:unnamed protein product [Phytophthora lilii]